MGPSAYEWVIEHHGMLETPSKWFSEVATWVFGGQALSGVEGADIRVDEEDRAGRPDVTKVRVDRRSVA